MNNQLIEFYKLIGTDSEGRTLESTWKYADHALENCPDYIQWWFPTLTVSQYNPNAPKIGKEEIILFRNNAELSKNLLLSYIRFLRFLGLEHGARAPYVNKRYLWREFDHNHLRITRALESLRVLGQGKSADDFLEKLNTMHRFADVHVGVHTWEHWMATKRWDEIVKKEILK